MLRLLPKHLAASTPHLSVDGMTPRGPNLSHWPGNRTPACLKADLSTGICLNFARSSPQERAEVLGGVNAVLNDHYDTDGFLSLLAILRPDVALAREEVCLAAAATGDYQCWQTERAFAIDRIVAGLRRSPESPLANDLAGLDESDAEFRCYSWLIEHAERVLDDPESLADLWRPERAALAGELANQPFDTRVLHDAGLAILTTEHDASRFALNSRAGGAWRVLHVQDAGSETLYRYHDRTESWFEVTSFVTPPRLDLRLLAASLHELESGRITAPAQVDPNTTDDRADDTDAIQWWADPPDVPVPELYFGLPSSQEYGVITRNRRASQLAPTDVIATARRFFDLHEPATGPS